MRKIIRLLRGFRALKFSLCLCDWWRDVGAYLHEPWRGRSNCPRLCVCSWLSSTARGNNRRYFTFPEPVRRIVKKRRVDALNLELPQFKADFFKALSHPLRIKILELLCEGDKNVNELQMLIGSEGSAVSQQLSILRSKDIVNGTKNGNRVVYSLRDPMIKELLSIARQIFNNHLIDTISMLDKMQNEID